MTYFSLPCVSNSDLIALRKAFYCFEETYDPAEVFKFGNLVDAMLTEEHRVNYFYFTLQDSDQVINYAPSEFGLAKAMVKRCKADPVIKAFIAMGHGQKVFSEMLRFSFDGVDYEIKARCKFDSIITPIKTSVDYKSTGCTKRKSFIESIEHFNYDQQGAWYMDVGGSDRHWIIGISKKTKELFKYVIERGDETYKRGVSKYTFWAYRWLMFVEGFKTDTAQYDLKRR
jgi:hypothetical protein